MGRALFSGLGYTRDMQTLREHMQWREVTAIERIQDALVTHAGNTERAGRAQLEVLTRQHEAESQRGEALSAEMRSLSQTMLRSGDEQAAGLRQLEETLGRGLEGIRSELSDQFDGINTTLTGIQESIDIGFAQMAGLLTQINTKVGWSEPYKQFLAVKQEAFKRAQRGDWAGAVGKAVAALSIPDATGEPPDQIARDPLLCAFLARAIVSMQISNYGGPDPEDLGTRAFEQGSSDGSPADRQAAADGARVVALCRRARDDWDGALDWEYRSLGLEVRDPLGALARWLATEAVVERGAPETADCIAAYGVVYATFLPMWLTQPAFVGHTDAADEAVVAVRAALLTRLASAAESRNQQVALWLDGLAPAEVDSGAVVEGFGTAVTAPRAGVTLPLLAALVREQYRRIQRGDAVARTFVQDQSRALASRVEARHGELTGMSKSRLVADSAALSEAVDRAELAHSSVAKKLHYWENDLSWKSVGCGGAFAGFAVASALAQAGGSGAGPWVLVVFPALLGILKLARVANLRGATGRASDALESAKQALKAREDLAATETKAAGQTRDSLRRELAEVPRVIATLGHPPFIDGAAYHAIVAGLAGQGVTSHGLVADSADVWRGFEDYLGERRRPQLSAIVAVWLRAQAFCRA